MEWLIGIGIAGMLLICPLMMIGMTIGGWIIGRRAGASGHGSHGMMCMGHGAHSPGGKPGDTADAPR
jgi:hypothetical protein